MDTLLISLLQEQNRLLTRVIRLQEFIVGELIKKKEELDDPKGRDKTTDRE